MHGVLRTTWEEGMCPCSHQVAAHSAGDAARMLDVRSIRQLIDKRCAGEPAQNFSKEFLSVRSPNFHHAEPKCYLSIRLFLPARLLCEALPAGQARRPACPRAPELAAPCIVANLVAFMSSKSFVPSMFARRHIRPGIEP
jgi:hypothetical protein